MGYFRGRYGKIYHRGFGGCYPVNDGNPENDDDMFDEEAFEEAEGNAIDRYIDDMEARERGEW